MTYMCVLQPLQCYVCFTATSVRCLRLFYNHFSMIFVPCLTAKPDKSVPESGVNGAEKEDSIRSQVEGRSDLELTGKVLKPTQVGTNTMGQQICYKHQPVDNVDYVHLLCAADTNI